MAIAAAQEKAAQLGPNAQAAADAVQARQNSMRFFDAIKKSNPFLGEVLNMFEKQGVAYQTDPRSRDTDTVPRNPTPSGTNMEAANALQAAAVDQAAKNAKLAQDSPALPGS